MDVFGRSPLGKGLCAGFSYQRLVLGTTNPSEETMTILLYAHPYQIGVEGFYFTAMEDYETALATIKDRYGQQVEEFELQFINGSKLDACFAKAWRLTQANVRRFFEVAENWDDYAKLSFIIAVGETGYCFDPEGVTSTSFDVDIYFLDSLRDLAEEFVNEGLFGEIPSHLEDYIDYDAIALDLAMDYTEATIADTRLIYRCE